MQARFYVTRRLLLSLTAMASVPATARAGRGPEPDGGPPPLHTGSSQYTIIRPRRPVQPAAIRTAAGEGVELGRFGGRVVLLNFWATWCAPCVREMPSLDRLAADVAGEGIAIVPVSIDEDGVRPVARFYREHRLRHLEMYFDAGRRIAFGADGNRKEGTFALYGLPISYVIDAEGYAVGYITGAVDWDSDPANALLRYYVRRSGT